MSVEKFLVTGGVPLRGDVKIAGAKNAVLKLMAAAALSDEPSILRNVPRISDVVILRQVMRDIGFNVGSVEDGTLTIEAQKADWLFVPLEAAAKMRSSFILLGPMLARLSGLTRQQLRMRSSVLGAMIYPCLLLVVAVSVLALMIGYTAVSLWILAQPITKAEP